MRESQRDRRLRSFAARFGQDSGRSAPCVQPKTPDGHQRENVRSARDVSPRSVQFSVAKSVQFSVAIDREEGNRISEAHRYGLPWGDCESSGRNVSDRTGGLDSAHVAAALPLYPSPTCALIINVLPPPVPFVARSRGARDACAQAVEPVERVRRPDFANEGVRPPALVAWNERPAAGPRARPLASSGRCGIDGTSLGRRGRRPATKSFARVRSVDHRGSGRRLRNRPAHRGGTLPSPSTRTGEVPLSRIDSARARPADVSA